MALHRRDIEVERAALAAQVAALLRDARRRLAELDAALERYDDGTYGTCAVCGGRIGAERLAAVPGTEHCISCAR